MMNIDNFLNNITSNFNQYIQVLVTFVFVFLFLLFLKKVIIKYFKKIAAKTENQIDDLVVKVLDSWGYAVLAIISLGIAVQFISLSLMLNRIFRFILFISIAIYLARSIQIISNYFFDKAIDNRTKENQGFNPTILLFLKTISRIIIWVLVFLIVIQNLGYKITTLLGGLGIGGIAVAFAVQNILEDFFSSLSIYFDRPFEIGDYVVIGEDSGTVKKIGIKSTRIQTLQGEELIVSNKELTSTRIHNYKKMTSRRVSFVIAVEYETSHDKLVQIPKIVEKITTKNKKLEFSWCKFTELSDNSLNFEVVYHLPSRDYQLYLDIQEQINYDLVKTFREEKINFAYPTSRVFINK